MAELAKKGTYVKLLCHIWYDKKADNIHVTSSDADLPPTKMHMTAKRGTQSDTNLRTLLDNFGCGPKAAAKAAGHSMTQISEELDSIIETVQNHGDPEKFGPVLENLTKLQSMVDEELEV